MQANKQKKKPLRNPLKWSQASTSTKILMPRDEEGPLPPWVYNTAKSTFFNTSLSRLHLPNRRQLWQPPRLFLLSLRTVPPTARAPHPAPLWTVRCERCCSAFSKTQLKQEAVGTGISYFSCQLTCSSPQQGHTRYGELVPSAQMELAAAPAALRSRREQAGSKVLSLRGKK